VSRQVDPDQRPLRPAMQTLCSQEDRDHAEDLDGAPCPGRLQRFVRLHGARPWRWAGWPGVAVSICILAYYPVVSGWVFRHLWGYTVGTMPGHAGSGYSRSFEAYVASPGPSVFWYGLVLVTSGSIVAAGVQRGIEWASLILMTLFAVVVVALAAHALLQSGAARARLPLRA
jgi:neurotransmitter:Na+ symporter, NSS family